MPSVITLQQAKDHLRVSHTDEDDYIWLLCQAVYEYIEHYLDGSDYMSGDSPAVYPFSIKAAAQILVAELYEHREQQVTGTIIEENPTALRLLYPYRQNIGI